MTVNFSTIIACLRNLHEFSTSKFGCKGRNWNVNLSCFDMPLAGDTTLFDQFVVWLLVTVTVTITENARMYSVYSTQPQFNLDLWS